MADDRLRKLVLMLSSDQPGEVAAAAKAIDRVLKVQGRNRRSGAFAILENPCRKRVGMNSHDRTKMRRYQAHAAKARHEADATTDDVARQQLVERAGKYQRTASDLRKHERARSRPRADE
jgi:hypothetical protein